MSGIYIHIPFCKQRCNYCDFYKTTQISKKNIFISALIQELYHQKNYLKNSIVKTIYFGGGTPSVLTYNEIIKIIEAVYAYFSVDNNPEITLEANPDDLTKSYINNLRKTPVNRLSIGIQSFQDDLLKLMNRRHNSQQAIQSVKELQNAGFENISTDLIYGLPRLTNKMWEEDLTTMFSLNIKHLSAYHITYEQGTRFYKFVETKKIIPVDETDSLNQFKSLIAIAENSGFEHYEISNFAKKDFYSKHNTSYWMQKPYLGVGPSAHSYNLISRKWNVSDIDRYIYCINNDENYFQTEQLTQTDKYNEYLMTRFRTMWGISMDDIKNFFGNERLNILQKQLQKLKKHNLVFYDNNTVKLTQKGIFISDLILSDLMLVD